MSDAMEFIRPIGVTASGSNIYDEALGFSEMPMPWMWQWDGAHQLSFVWDGDHNFIHVQVGGFGEPVYHVIEVDWEDAEDVDILSFFDEHCQKFVTDYSNGVYDE
jgi:hypothetical protein